MIRQRDRAAVLVGVVLFCVAGGAPDLHAQTALSGAGALTDPFTFYYGVYLPNQQLQSLRSSPNDTINQAMVTRQYYNNQSDRSGLYDPISPYADDSSDPLRPFSNRGKERIARAHRFSQDPSNSSGQGPSLYYGRASQYFPGLKSGIGRNSNVAPLKRGGGGGGRGSRVGGPGMGGMGAGGGMGGGGMGGMGGGMGMY